MSLSRLRVRLTLWYAATFTLILVLLGAGLFLAIGTQVSRRIDLSLAGATAAIVRATHDLENERAAGGAADAVEELHIPDRELYLFDVNGRPLTPPSAEAWIVDAARAAATNGSAGAQHVTGGCTLSDSSDAPARRTSRPQSPIGRISGSSTRR